MLKAIRSYRPRTSQPLAQYQKTFFLKSRPHDALASTSTIRGVSSGAQYDDCLFPKSTDPVFHRLREAHVEYRLGQRDLGSDGSKNMHDTTWFPGSSASQIHPVGPANRFAGNANASANAGDPLGCDSAEMRMAKAGSQYAWVTCEAEFEKYVLQAQDTAYFFVERDPDSDAPRYRFGYALARPVSEVQQLFNHTIDNHWFRFQPKVIVSNTASLKDAFKGADLLLSKMVEDGWLEHILKRDAEWRSKPCSIRQLDMLLRMQWAYALKCGKNLPEDKLDLLGDALSMDNGQLSCLLSALLHSHFDPADDWLYGERAGATGSEGINRPLKIVALPRPTYVRLGERCNNFWEGR